jgi:L-amino acid N-acyltransferase YncA
MAVARDEKVAPDAPHHHVTTRRGAPAGDRKVAVSTGQAPAGDGKVAVVSSGAPAGAAGDGRDGSAAPRPSPFRLTLVDATHAEGTRRIYNEAVETSTATFEMTPRTLAEQLEWVAEHSGAYPALVALGPGGDVAGFGSLSPYRPRPAYSTTVEDSVYVDEAYRRQGVGRALLEELVSLARSHGFHAVIARIAGDNEASVALHATCGFETIGVEREVGRKFGRWLDVVCMERLV